MDKSEMQGLPQHLIPQLQLLFNQAQHMREIVDMVLDWSSLEADYNKLKIQKTQLNEWVTEVIKDYMNEAKEKEICIQLQIDPNIEEVWFDKQKCQTVLSNLLMNALKFSKANSNITVSTQRLENTVRISVIDEGSGIEDSDMANLFTKFHKGNHKERGSGFGLYYAKTIMEMHGGLIRAYNNTNKGATFYLELPLLNTNKKEESAHLQQKGSPLPSSLSLIHI